MPRSKIDAVEKHPGQDVLSTLTKIVSDKQPVQLGFDGACSANEAVAAQTAANEARAKGRLALLNQALEGLGAHIETNGNQIAILFPSNRATSPKYLKETHYPKTDRVKAKEKVGRGSPNFTLSEQLAIVLVARLTGGENEGSENLSKRDMFNIIRNESGHVDSPFTRFKELFGKFKSYQDVCKNPWTGARRKLERICAMEGLGLDRGTLSDLVLRLPSFIDEETRILLGQVSAVSRFSNLTVNEFVEAVREPLKKKSI